MKIGEAIKQNNWKSEQQKLQVNIIYTYFWLKENMSNALKPFGITMQQYNVLRILRGQHPNGITTSDIRSRMLDKMCDASRMVDRLEKIELVAKKVNNKDRRLVCVTITEKGLALIEKIIKIENENDNFAHNLTNAEAEQMNLMLDRIRENKD